MQIAVFLSLPETTFLDIDELRLQKCSSARDNLQNHKSGGLHVIASFLNFSHVDKYFLP
jgi:hypothetical protein